MDSSTIYYVARHELTVNIRNKWTVIFALVFGALVVGISYVGIIAEGRLMYQGTMDEVRQSGSLEDRFLQVVGHGQIERQTLSWLEG